MTAAKRPKKRKAKHPRKPFAKTLVRPESGHFEIVIGWPKDAVPPTKSWDAEAGSEIVCPVCGASCVQRRCKVVCESDQCRGRVVLNCSEF
jgi:hypothetical protein